MILSHPHHKASLLAPPAPSGGAWGDASPQTPAKRTARVARGLDIGNGLWSRNGLWSPLPSMRRACLRPLHALRLAIGTALANADAITSTAPATTLTSTFLIIGRTVCMAGVWGEASPQAPPEGAGGARRETLVPPLGAEGG